MRVREKEREWDDVKWMNEKKKDQKIRLARFLDSLIGLTKERVGAYEYNGIRKYTKRIFSLRTVLIRFVIEGIEEERKIDFIHSIHYESDSFFFITQI